VPHVVMARPAAHPQDDDGIDALARMGFLRAQKFAQRQARGTEDAGLHETPAIGQSKRTSELFASAGGHELTRRRGHLHSRISFSGSGNQLKAELLGPMIASFAESWR